MFLELTCFIFQNRYLDGLLRANCQWTNWKFNKISGIRVHKVAIFPEKLDFFHNFSQFTHPPPLSTTSIPCFCKCEHTNAANSPMDIFAISFIETFLSGVACALSPVAAHALLQDRMRVPYSASVSVLREKRNAD